MATEPSSVEIFRESLARATEAQDFFERFYRRFVGSSDEIARIFQGKDMDRVEHKLEMTLEMVCDNADGMPGLTMYLEMLGKIHGGMRIAPRHFALWREALLATAAERDPAFDPRARAAWESVIDDLMAKMGELPGEDLQETRR